MAPSTAIPELLVRARSDPEAIGELFARHARGLERFLVRRQRRIDRRGTDGRDVRGRPAQREGASAGRPTRRPGVSSTASRATSRACGDAGGASITRPARGCTCRARPADYVSEVEERAAADVLAPRLERAVERCRATSARPSSCASWRAVVRRGGQPPRLLRAGRTSARRPRAQDAEGAPRMSAETT